MIVEAEAYIGEDDPRVTRRRGRRDGTRRSTDRLASPTSI